MELDKLEAFAQVAHEGSFTRAAKSLGLTQPSVSTRISVLEAELDCELFIRSGRRLSLTSMGKALLPYAERALWVLQEGKQAVLDHKIGKRGHISIVVLDTLAISILPKPMQRFREEYPHIDFAVHLCMPREILNLLYDGTAHLGLIRGPLWDRGVEIVARFQEPIQAIVNADHPFVKRGEICVADIPEYPIYSVPLNPSATAFVEHLIVHARSSNPVSKVSLPAIMVVPLLLKEHGVAFLPETFVHNYLESGDLTVLHIVDLPNLSHESLLVKLAGRELDKLHQELRRMIRAQWRKILVDKRT